MLTLPSDFLSFASIAHREAWLARGANGKGVRPTYYESSSRFRHRRAPQTSTKHLLPSCTGLLLYPLRDALKPINVQIRRASSHQSSAVFAKYIASFAVSRREIIAMYNGSEETKIESREPLAGAKPLYILLAQLAALPLAICYDHSLCCLV